MKKTIITLILLLGVGTTVFFLGWVQLDVPAGSWGVLRSKTHGVSAEPVREGRFRWVWYKLIPGNVETAVFTLREEAIPLDISGALPSGDVYAALAGLKTGFSYRLSLSITWRPRGESLPALARRENLLSQEDLDRILPRLSAVLENRARNFLWASAGDEELLKEARETGRIRALEESLSEALPEAEILDCSVKTLEYPDFVLYDEARSLYRDYLAAQREGVRNEVAIISSRGIEARRRFEELSGYGELLSKYPVLLKYLALERGLPPNAAGD